MKSTQTKIYHKKLWLYRFIDITIQYVPLAVYIVHALSSDSVSNGGKITVIGTLAIALFFCIFNVLAAKKLRCPIWIIFLGLYIALGEILPLIIILAVTSILDDFILSPIIDFEKTKYIASTVIDERE